MTGIGMGICTHLVLDLFNGIGISLLWPLGFKVSLGNILSDSAGGWIVSVILGFISLAVFYSLITHYIIM